MKDLGLNDHELEQVILAAVSGTPGRVPAKRVKALADWFNDAKVATALLRLVTDGEMVVEVPDKGTNWVFKRAGGEGDD